MDGVAYQATPIHGVANSQTPLSNFTCSHLEISRESEMGAHGEKYCQAEEEIILKTQRKDKFLKNGLH